MLLKQIAAVAKLIYADKSDNFVFRNRSTDSQI